MSDLHPPGTIAVPGGDLARYQEFTFSLAKLKKPNGSTLAMHCGLSVHRNLNMITREMTGEWLWLQGDDHVFPEDLLIQLLDRQVDVIVPLMYKRTPPFTLVLYERSRVNEEGEVEYEPYRPSALPSKGIVKVHAAGTGGMLIRKHVLDAIGDPWFTTTGADNQNEDLEFCRKIRDAGFDIWADTEAWMGHIGRMQVWPGVQDGESGMVFQFDDKHRIFFRDSQND